MMNLKKTWNGKYGKSEIITRKNSTVERVEIDALKLHDGETKKYSECGKEYGITILGGKCSVTGDGFSFEKIGKRKNVFDGTATCVYIPRNKEFTIKGEGEVSMIVAKCPSEKDCAPRLISPDDIIVKSLGKPGWQRDAHFVLDERCDADMIYIGEAYVEGGQWSSFPPHKHDDDNMPTEADTEEVYYYEFDKPEGFGIQMIYSKEGDVDETIKVKTGDFAEIHRGYHPLATAPGYKCYYYWVMAGKNRGFFMTTDEEHAWLNK